jgi:peptide subunit release factor 1 (eRF1)
MVSEQSLAGLAHFKSEHADAISFYLGPQKPTELTHRQEAILTKEKIQEVFGDLEGNSPSVRDDLHRILETAAAMKGNHSRAKVLFACGRRGLWREFDVDQKMPVFLEAAERFRVAPLLARVQKPLRYCVALADRNRARLLIMEGEKIHEHSEALDEERDPEVDKVRTTGTGGSSHVERQREEAVRRHFEFLASHLLHFHEHGDFDALIVGCRDEMWPEIEGVLHTEIKRVLLGHFRIDPGLAKAEEVQEKAAELAREHEREEYVGLFEQAVAGAAADGLGAVGLPSVLRALEQGEVETLLWSPPQQTEKRPVGECSHCTHLQLGQKRNCDLCGGLMEIYSRPEEAFARRALASGIKMRGVEDETLAAPDEFAAVLRFRADHSTARVLTG